MLVFRKIWLALFSCYLRFEIHLFALLPTSLTFYYLKLTWLKTSNFSMTLLLTFSYFFYYLKMIELRNRTTIVFCHIFWMHTMLGHFYCRDYIRIIISSQMVWNMFKVNIKNTRTKSLTSFWCFYCWLGTYFKSFSSVSIIDFEQVNVSWGNSGIV